MEIHGGGFFCTKGTPERRGSRNPSHACTGMRHIAMVHYQMLHLQALGDDIGLLQAKARHLAHHRVKAAGAQIAERSMECARGDIRNAGAMIRELFRIFQRKWTEEGLDFDTYSVGLAERGYKSTSALSQSSNVFIVSS